MIHSGHKITQGELKLAENKLIEGLELADRSMFRLVQREVCII